MVTVVTLALEHFTPATISDAVVRERLAHANLMLAEEHPSDPPLLAEDAIARMRNLPSTARLEIWIARKRGRIVADATLGWQELETNRELAWIDVSLLPEARGAGLGRLLLRRVLERSIAGGRTLLQAESSDRVPSGGRFLQRLGFATGLATHTNQLDLRGLDRAVLARWIGDGMRRAAGYRVELWDGPVPEARLEAYATLVNVMNGEPRGTLAIEDWITTPAMIREGEVYLFANGSRRLIACAVDATGRLAGFTELVWNPKRAALVWQAGTGVLADHRGKGLGRWLKGANMAALLAANSSARFVRTGNADSNAPMLAINREMGFVPYAAILAWQARAPAVLEALAGRNKHKPAA